MSGIEIERMLKMIDASIDANRRLQNDEMLRYIQTHEHEIAQQLLRGGQVSIPTSTGTVTIPMSVLRAA